MGLFYEPISPRYLTGTRSIRRHKRPAMTAERQVRSFEHAGHGSMPLRTASSGEDLEPLPRYPLLLRERAHTHLSPRWMLPASIRRLAWRGYPGLPRRVRIPAWWSLCRCFRLPKEFCERSVCLQTFCGQAVGSKPHCSLVPLMPLPPPQALHPANLCQLAWTRPQISGGLRGKCFREIPTNGGTSIALVPSGHPRKISALFA